MSELRYDGPDLESDASGRIQGLLMTSMMVAEGLRAGRDARTARHQHDDDLELDDIGPAAWQGGGELPELGDGTLARRWTAAANQAGDPAADEARAEIEAELGRRDPQTMRDYRSWVHGAGIDDPTEAMRLALADREHRLEQAWKPLATQRGSTLTADQLAEGWVAALGSHHPDAPAAAAAGEALLREQLPDLMADYDSALNALTPTPAGTREPGLVTPHTAAQQTLGQPLAFGPQSAWSDLTTPTTAAPTRPRRVLAWRPTTPDAAAAQATTSPRFSQH